MSGGRGYRNRENDSRGSNQRQSYNRQDRYDSNNNNRSRNRSTNNYNSNNINTSNNPNYNKNNDNYSQNRNSNSQQTQYQNNHNNQYMNNQYQSSSNQQNSYQQPQNQYQQSQSQQYQNYNQNQNLQIQNNYQQQTQNSSQTQPISFVTQNQQQNNSAINETPNQPIVQPKVGIPTTHASVTANKTLENKRKIERLVKAKPVVQTAEALKLKRIKEENEENFINTLNENCKKQKLANDLPRRKFWIRTNADLNANRDLGAKSEEKVNILGKVFNVNALFIPPTTATEFDFEPFIVSELGFNVIPKELHNQSLQVGIKDDQPQQSDKKLVCKHWLRSLCKKGDNCEFLHEYNLKKMPKCWFFAKYGRCDNPECLYLHSDPEAKKPECPAFTKGFCYTGPQCQFLHIRRALCANYICGFCPDGPKCKYGHPR